MGADEASRGDAEDPVEKIAVSRTEPIYTNGEEGAAQRSYSHIEPPPLSEPGGETEECPTADEIFHQTVSEVPRKDLVHDVRCKKDLSALLQDKLGVVLDITELTHRDIIAHLLSSMWTEMAEPPDREAIKGWILGPRREDGTVTWKESIEGRNFVVVIAEVPGLTSDDRRVSVGRLHTPLNLSYDSSERLVRFVGLVIAPAASQSSMQTKTAYETGRTVAALLSDAQFRLDAEGVQTEKDFIKAGRGFISRMEEARSQAPSPPPFQEEEKPMCRCPGAGLVEDVKRRLKWYKSDFTEAAQYPMKVLSTAVYLMCIILAPAIAFGSIMGDKTKNHIGAMEILLSQAVSGFIFSLLGGCPFVIIMTTGPLTVFIGFMYDLTDSMDIKFLPFYAWVGVWNSFFLLLLVVFNVSDHIHYVTAFVDQIFACLVAGIFAYEAIKPTGEHFFTPSDGAEAAGSMGVVLSIGTFILAVKLLALRESDYLNSTLRHYLSDYSTAVSIIIMTAIYWLAKVDFVETLEVPDTIELTMCTNLTTFPDNSTSCSERRDLLVDMTDIPVYAVFVAAGPAALLCSLFFLDENITSILSNKKEFKLRKGEAMHLDLFVVASINIVLGVLGLPFLHGALPQSPLHVLQLADQEEYREQGVLVKRVVKSRETRTTALLCHILIAVFTICGLPALKSVPVPVLHGVFLTMAYQGASSNPFVERILLWFTQVSKYPPSHLVRRVRLAIIHKWTVVQLICFAVLWGVKSSPAALGFPFIIVLLVVVRHKLLPRLFTPTDIHLLESH